MSIPIELYRVYAYLHRQRMQSVGFSPAWIGYDDAMVLIESITGGGWTAKEFPRPMSVPDPREVVKRERKDQTQRKTQESEQYQTNLESLFAQRTQQLRGSITDLERSYNVTLEVFIDALEFKDPESARHSRRVAAFTMAIARHMGVPKDQTEVIARGAFLHDIGKMSIPDAVLRKPAKLTLDEIAAMREHSYLGYKLVQKMPALNEPAEIIYCHHERYDGTGYPRGLKGDEIPLGARMVAVANVLDAITSDCCYRQAQPFEAARSEILAWSGRQFDPGVVKAFLSIPESLWQEMRRAVDAQSRPQTWKGSGLQEQL